MISKFRRLGADVAARLTHPHAVPLAYYSKTPNVGDLVNLYMVPRISGRPVYKAQTARLPHLRAVGSLVGSATRHSHIWGSGSIDGALPAHPVDASKITALRGRRTLELLSRIAPVDEAMPLGDPALLLPMFFAPALAKTHALGLIPHFSEIDAARALLEEAGLEAKLLDVRQGPESFVTELLGCERVVSSSLHGLILSDAYDVPNLWVSFTDDLLGGTWKFLDYYSVTSTPEPSPFLVRNAAQMKAAVAEALRNAEVSRYTGELSRLLAAFPKAFMGRV